MPAASQLIVFTYKMTGDQSPVGLKSHGDHRAPTDFRVNDINSNLYLLVYGSVARPAAVAG